MCSGLDGRGHVRLLAEESRDQRHLVNLYGLLVLTLFRDGNHIKMSDINELPGAGFALSSPSLNHAGHFTCNTDYRLFSVPHS